VTLSTIDEKWMDHLDEMDSLREGIWLRGDKNTVLSEYKKEAFNMFESLIDSVESTIANRIFRVHVQDQPQVRVDLSRVQEVKEDVFEPLAKEVADATPPSAAKAPTNIKGSANDLAAALAGARAAKKPTPGSATVKIGRNDPCPCGSGLKYKKCGLINAPEHRG
jgi:preprotein translocase subunit SecA